MKTSLKHLHLIVLALLTFSCSSDDDGSTTTGNTQEYFKYTINGVERIFDYEVEAHLETETGAVIDKYEIYAIGQQTTGDLRRISAVFTFDNAGSFMPATSYNWGIAIASSPAEKFYFSESTFSHLFMLSPDYSAHQIVATVTSSIPVSVGDYLEFTFTGTFTDENNNSQNISGTCRVQRDADQNF